jgi:catechol 2,3-dioxygenase-like lactoylglutathione lyase family enzyme
VAEPARPAIFDAVTAKNNLFRAMKLEGIDHVALAVPDVARTVDWYHDVLGFQPLHAGAWGGVPAFIGLGSTALALFPAESSAGAGSRGGPMLHLAFRASRREYERAQEELKKREIAFRFEDHGIAHSIYFRDLNNLPLEITTYEMD